MEDAQRPRLAAAHLLDRLHTFEGCEEADATPVDALAEHLGLAVASFPPEMRRAGTLGWLEPGEDLIFLRDGVAEPVRRFTLAHEIGHYILHRAHGAARTAWEAPDTLEPCDDVDLATPFDVLDNELLPQGQVYSARAQRESEANAFASCLLLPADKLLARYLMPAGEKTTRRSKRPNTRALAQRFGVSEEVLHLRLTTLLTAMPDESVGARADTESAPARARRHSELDQWQREAAESDTPALIIAGPGTGKTSTLVARVGYLVQQRGVRASGILALTFSNKAAREMRERLHALLTDTNEAVEDDPLAESALPTVSTIHAFCGELLRKYAPLVGLRPDFRLISETDGYLLLRRLAGHLPLSYYQPLGAPAFHFPALLAAISRAKDELAGPAEYVAAAREMAQRARTESERTDAARAAEVARVYEAYQAALVERGDADFGDVIRLAVHLLRTHPEVLAEVQQRYQHVLVDEFQDINRAMGVLLRTLAGPDGPLWAVGDADQAIYRFRGASPANIAGFTADYPTAQKHALRQSYRSVSDILEAAAAVAGAYLDRGQRIALDATRPPATGLAVTLATADSNAAEIAGIAAAMRARQAAGCALADQVVLCRTRRQCQRVAAGLADAGIPTRVVAPLLEQPDVKDLLAIPALLADTSGAGLLRAGNLPEHHFCDQDARAVLAEARARHRSPLTVLLRHVDGVPGLTAEGRRGLTALRQVVADLRQAPDVPTGLARYAFSLTGLGQRLLSGIHAGDEDARAQASRLAHLLALARSFEDQRSVDLSRTASDAHLEAVTLGGARWADFLDYVRVLAVLRQEVGDPAGDQVASERDEVRVLTVHASKGLEFPVVYLPGLADRRFPLRRRGDTTPLPASLREAMVHPAHESREHLAEEARLFYVAVTRARNELVLSYAGSYGRMRARPSPFLSPIRSRLGKRLSLERWEAVPSAGGAALPAPALEQGAPVREVISQAPIRPAAIETFRRCPRQYAYRYVYELQPPEVGLATLRRALHDTLDALHQRFLDGAQESADASGWQTPSLDDAYTLFDHNWMVALAREHGRLERSDYATIDAHQPAADGAAAPADAVDASFSEVYRRHGRQIVEREWRHLARKRDHAARTGSPTVPAREPGVEFDRAVIVRVGDCDISVTLDRVERIDSPAPTDRQSGSLGATHADAVASTAPLRVVRHRLGRAATSSPDLRILLYALAGEQSMGAESPQFYQRYLESGEMARVALDRHELAKLREELDRTLEGMRSGVYPPRPDPVTCQSCPFLLICPTE